MPIQLDAKLNAFRRSSKGFFITLEIGPDCDWAELAAAPLGQAFGVAMVAYDAETGKASPGTALTGAETPTGQQRGEAGKPQAEPSEITGREVVARSRKPFHELSRAQQAGILSNDVTFGLWLSKVCPEIVAADTADAVRKFCRVSSRAELSEDRVAGKRWDALVTQFFQETGRMAEAR